MLGGAFTSIVAWRVLSDTKAARKRTEEREATGIITTSFQKTFLVYTQQNVRVAPVPEGFELWTDYFRSALDEAEVAIQVIRDRRLRLRLSSSLEMLIHGGNEEILRDTRLNNPDHMASVAYRDALACLGANLRNEPLPEPSRGWKAATEFVVVVSSV
jgi:hypothetical protein